MRESQTMPTSWLIARSWSPEIRRAAERLPRGGAILLLEETSKRCEREFRKIGRRRGLYIVREGRGTARRVHDVRELRSALLQRDRIILLSPLYPTRTHPDWKPIPRMRAAALARLAGRKLLALGGMNEKRFEGLRTLGFAGWAGISRWMEPANREG